MAKPNMKAQYLLVGVLILILGSVSVLAIRSLTNEPRPVRDLDDWPGAGQTASTSQINLVERAVRPGGLIDLPIRRFQNHMHRLPVTMDELERRPDELKENEKWDGPYIRSPKLLLDPWGNKYEYLAPGNRNPRRYDLWSVGPDGISGNEDDILN